MTEPEIPDYFNVDDAWEKFKKIPLVAEMLKNFEIPPEEEDA